MQERNEALPWLFFALAFTWTWAWWATAAASGASIATPGGLALLLLGLSGPALAGIGCARFADGGWRWADYRARLVEPRRITGRWLLVILLFAPALMAVALLLDAAIHGGGALALVAERAQPLLAVSSAGPFLLGQLVFGPLPEEPGWRGYALDPMQELWGPLAASLMLGIAWAIWHLPLFLIDGTWHHGQGLWSTGFWLFLAGVVPTAVVFTWVFNHTGGSTLGAVLLHFTINLAYVLGNVTSGTNVFATLLWFAAAATIVLFRSVGPRI